MRWLKFILSHSIFISFCALALSVQSFILYKEPVNIPACSLLFLLTMASYNMYWMLSRLSLEKNSLLRDSISNILLGLSSVAGSIFLLSFYPSFIPHLVIPIVLTLIYSMPLWPWKFFRTLRKAGFMKTVLLSFAWSWNTLFLPLQIRPSEVGIELLILFGARFFFMMMLCLIFDSRDAKIDKIHSLSSLATQLTSNQLSWFFNITFILFIGMGFLFRVLSSEHNQLIAFGFTGMVTWITYRFSLKPRGYYFYYFYVDGLMLFSSLASFLASIL